MAEKSDLAVEAATAELDEQKLVRIVGYGLPLVTLVTGAGAGVWVGAPMAILALAAGLMIGVIAILWASIRVLSGDAALPPEVEALDRSAHASDALLVRKKMLLRALKDLDGERALGKLDEDDYQQVGETYRTELKEVLRQMDEALSPYRERAEWEANAFLQKQGLGELGYRGAGPTDEDEADDDAAPVVKTKAKAKAEAKPRVACPKCETSNEPDAAFCKKCGTGLTTKREAEETDVDDAKETST